MQIKGTFEDSSGTVTDPATIAVDVVDATGVTTTYSYSGGTVTKVSTGVYTVNLDTTAKPGRWQYRWYSTGTGQAANTGQFLVSPFPPLTR